MRLAVHGLGVAADFGTGADLLRLAEGGAPPGGPDRAQAADTSALAERYSPRELRRLDHFTRMCLLAAHRALEDAGQTGPDGTAIVLASGYGPAQTTFDFLDSLIEFGEACASPLAFSHSVHNIPAATVAMLLGMQCPSMSLCQAEAPVHAGLAAAWTWLAEGRAERVLFIAADERTTLLEEILGRVRPGSRPGEGAAAFVLGRAPAAGLPSLELDAQMGPDAPAVDLRQSYGDIPVGPAFDLAAAVGRTKRLGAPAAVRTGGPWQGNLLVVP